MSPEPFTAFLDWMSTVLVPNWNELVAMLPLWILIGVTMPLLTLIALAWVYHFMTRQRANVKRTVPDVVAATRAADGTFVIPANVPYNPSLGLIYPPDRTQCEADGSNLMVRCPVDGTVREADLQTCRGCGTKFVLGAATTPLLVQRTGSPPAGGAAAA